jgi:hypothetical protein
MPVAINFEPDGKYFQTKVILLEISTVPSGSDLMETLE